VSARQARRPDAAARQSKTAIERCVRSELGRHLTLLDGEPPSELYRLVMRQAESALLETVLEACDGNRSRAAAWLGIGRGTLRSKLADHEVTARAAVPDRQPAEDLTP